MRAFGSVNAPPYKSVRRAVSHLQIPPTFLAPPLPISFPFLPFSLLYYDWIGAAVRPV